MHSARHPLAMEIFGAEPADQGNSNEGKASLFHIMAVITGPRFAESLGAEKLAVSVRFHSQNDRKPQKEMCP